MSSVLDIAALTMRTEMSRVEAAAHNVANATTAGFKRQLSVANAASAAASASTASPFNALLQQAQNAADVKAAGLMNQTAALTASNTASDVIHTDLAAGKLSATGNPLNLALAGDGFFTVRQGDQVLYTRAGNFERAADGRVVTPQGAVLQLDGGDLITSGADFTVLADGTVLEGQRPLGRLQLVQFADAALLKRSGSGSFSADASNATAASANTLVKQGFLEMANVDVGHEMVQLMETMRRFELGQKIALAHEDMMDRAIRRLGDLQS